MSPRTLGPNDLLQDDNYFLWEFNARMALARKNLLSHVQVKSENAMEPRTAEWEASDMKALGILVQLLSPNYQAMVREAKSAREAWETLRTFFVQKNLHNRVQLRKQLHSFEMASGENSMDHLMRFEDLCVRLSAVGETITESEKLVILLGSLPPEYDGMIKIIEAHGSVTLLEAKEMLRREFETIKKRDRQEGAFRADAQDSRRGRVRSGAGRSGGERAQDARGRRGGGQQQNRQRKDKGFNGRCFECNKVGHKRAECPQERTESGGNGGEFVFSVSSDTRTTCWLLDSGASSHMSFGRGEFCEFRALESAMTVTVASGERLRVAGIGSVCFAIGASQTVKLTDVLFVPELDCKLLSIPSLVAKGAEVLFRDGHCDIRFGGRLIARVHKERKLFLWQAKSVGEREMPENAAAAATARPTEAQLWHARLGHIGASRMPIVARAVDGVPVVNAVSDKQDVCAGCAMGKLSTSAFPHRSGSTVKTTGVLDLVHSDVVGPMQCSSKGGARFIVTFIDDFSRFVHVFLLSAKSQVFQSFVTYKNLVENQTGARVKCLRSDNGKEFINKRVRAFCGEQGIIQQTSAPYSPQQNGLAERMNRTIVEMARSMLHYMGLELEWWGEAVNAAVYTINRVPNTARPHVSPFEVLFGKRPDLSHLRVFGSRGFVHVEKSKRSKWDPKAHRCIFLGYSDTSKAYRVWDLETERLLTSRTVILDENPPASYSDLPPRADNTLQVAQWIDSDDDVARSGTQSPSLSTNEDIEMTSSEPDGIQAVNDCAEDMDVDERGADTAMVPSQPGAVLLHQAESGGEEQLLSLQRQPALPAPTLARSLTAAPRYASTTALAPLSRGGEQLVFNGGSRPNTTRPNSVPRILPSAESPHSLLPMPTSAPSPDSPDGSALTYIAPALLENGPTTEDNDNTEASPTRGCSDDMEPDPKRQRVDDEYEIALSAVELPRSYREAVESPEHDQWKQAIRAELRAHFRNHTWDLVRKPPGAKVIGHKWVFAVKRDEHGVIVRYKARLVALGCLQTFGVDYTDTYSPVASMNTVRTFLAVCCCLDYFVKQYDIETAFLNGDLDEVVFMTVPAGMKVDADKVCQLRRSLYGLKQAAAVWFRTIRDVFRRAGSVQCAADTCLFVKRSGRAPVFVVLYVDDLLIGCKYEEDAEEVRRELAKHFTVKELGDVRYVLGMEVKYDTKKGELWLGQKQFIERMVDKFRQTDAYPVRNPTLQGQELHVEDGPLSTGVKPFRELIGSLLYVANATRPDICVAVGALSRYLEQPREKHWQAGIRVLRYLKGTSSTGIKFRRPQGSACSVAVFCDANWGGDIATRRSTSGILIQVAGAPVVYKSKLQQTVALSSAEAEYMSMALAVQEVVWLRHLLEEMGLKAVGATPVYVDNKSAISIATNHGYTPRAKHIDLRAHFVRDHVAKETINVIHVPSAKQLADYLTKPLPTPQFTALLQLSGVVSSDAS